MIAFGITFELPWVGSYLVRGIHMSQKLSIFWTLVLVAWAAPGFCESSKPSHREEADLTRPVLSAFEGVFDREVRKVGEDKKLCPVLKVKDKTYRIRTYTDSPCLETIKNCTPGTRCTVKGELSAEGDLWADEFTVFDGRTSPKQKAVENCFSILRAEMSINWFDEQLWAACLGAEPDCIIKQCRANKELYPEDFVEACGGTYDQNKQPDWDVSRLKVKPFKDLKSVERPRPPVISPAPSFPSSGSSSGNSSRPCQFWRAEAEGKGPIHNGSCGFYPGSGPTPWAAENMALNTCRQNAGKSPHGEVCRCIIVTPARCMR